MSRVHTQMEDSQKNSIWKSLSVFLILPDGCADYNVPFTAWNKQVTLGIMNLMWQWMNWAINRWKQIIALLFNEGKNFAIILVWVDGMITLTNSPVESDCVEQEIQGKFEIKALSEPSMLLGWRFLTTQTLNILPSPKLTILILFSRNLILKMLTLYHHPLIQVSI